MNKSKKAMIERMTIKISSGTDITPTCIIVFSFYYWAN